MPSNVMLFIDVGDFYWCNSNDIKPSCTRQNVHGVCLAAHGVPTAPYLGGRHSVCHRMVFPYGTILWSYSPQGTMLLGKNISMLLEKMYKSSRRKHLYTFLWNGRHRLCSHNVFFPSEKSVLDIWQKSEAMSWILTLRAVDLDLD